MRCISGRLNKLVLGARTCEYSAANQSRVLGTRKLDAVYVEIPTVVHSLGFAAMVWQDPRGLTSSNSYPQMAERQWRRW